MKTKRGIWLSGVALAAVGVAVNGSFGHANKAHKEMAVEHVQEPRTRDSEFKVELVVDREQYRVGDQVVVGFRTNRDAHVTLLNIGSSGNVQIVFPNEHHKDNLVKRDEIYRLPPEAATFAFNAIGPAGQDVIKAIATLDNQPAVAQAAASKDLAVILQDMANNSNLKRWAEATKVITVVE